MKRMILLAILAMVPVIATAHDENDKDTVPVAINGFFDNWFIGAGAGVNTILDNGFLGKTGLGADAYIGKWFTPSMGARIGWHGLSNKALDTSNGWFAGADAFSFNYAHVDWIWDVLNTFRYNENRVVNPRLGVQAGCIFTGYNGITNQEFGMGPMAQVSFRLGRRVEVNFEGTFILAREEAYRKAGQIIAFPAVTAGVTVNVGKVGFERKVKVVTREIVKVEDCGHDMVIAGLLAQLDSIKALRAKAPEVEIEFITRPDIVYFDLDKDKLTRRELAHLEFLMSQLPEGAELYITGHADKETGNPRHNLNLSKRRAETIANTLRSWGFPADKIHIDWKGDTDNLPYAWDKMEKNRCCYIRVVL